MSWRKESRRVARYAALRAAIASHRIVPRPLSLACWSALGAISSRVLPRTWRRTVEHLAAAYPELTPSDRERLARRVFREVAKNASDVIRLGSWRGTEVDRWAEAEDWSHFEAAHRRGRGVIVLTGHIGCWELLGALICGRGYPLHVLARPLREERLDALVRRLREGYGARALDARRSLRAALQVLRSGGAVGLLLDLNTGEAGVQVPFFGRPAWTPLSAAWLARKSGAAVVPMAIGRAANGRHLVRTLPPLEFGPGEATRERLEADTAVCVAAIEELIRHDPTQWIWFHPRWRARRRAAVVAVA